MLELVVSVCLLEDHSRCKEVSLTYMAESTTPMQCMMMSPAEIAQSIFDGKLRPRVAEVKRVAGALIEKLIPEKTSKPAKKGGKKSAGKDKAKKGDSKKAARKLAKMRFWCPPSTKRSFGDSASCGITMMMASLGRLVSAMRSRRALPMALDVKY